ncbi:MAG TPA: DUF4838 domain-containing protein [Candidatus Hydrogenedentes bacterium]|nr:DUF4838 domain-containing protein [Candidatus Hydrogenedentota bacterium]
MKRVIGCLFVCLLVMTAVYGEWMVKEGKSAYVIVLQAGASPSEKVAAEELKSYVKACTGVELTITSDKPGDGIPMIVLGCGPVAEALGVSPAAEQLGEQGYCMRAISPHLVIAGTSAAGTLYGVRDFIEQYLGVRWYAPGVTKAPQASELLLPEVDTIKKPVFAYRQTTYGWPGGDAEFRSRQGENAGSGGPDNAQGIQYAFDGICHSYFNFISPGEFFDAHPEYFSEIGGVRRKTETQLCLTNPDVLEIVTERMLKRMADNPNARQHNFSQMDCYNYCQCAKCREINERYGTRGGTQYWFLNQLAERTAKVYPGKLIGTLAYMYTEEPPKGLVMHPNIAVWLCHMFPSCDSHPIASCPLNAEYKRRGEAWAKICSHVYVWHYIVDFAHYFNPFPNFRAMAADMKYYRDIGVEGMFLQGMGPAGGEFGLLRPYYGMKLLWNPDQDPEALIQDFLEGYYGAASGPMYQYITLLHDKVQNENIHMHLYTNPGQGYLTDEVMTRAGELFDQAEEAVKADAELLERVRVARMPLTYARFFPRNGFTLEEDRLSFNGEIAQLPEIMTFLDRMKQHNFPTLREHGGDPAQLAVLGLVINAPVPVETIRNAALTVQAVPFFSGRALRVADNASGQSVTAYNTVRYLAFPFEGGEETRIGTEFDTGQECLFERFETVEKTATSVAMEVKTPRGMLVRRTLSLVEDQPKLRVTVDVTNTTDKPKEQIVRSHLALDLGELAKTRVRFTDRAGLTVERDMAPIIAGLREGEHYFDQHAPKGEWMLTGSKGLQVTERFDDAGTDYTWLYAYPEYLNVLECEVWAKPVTLAPGEKMSRTIELEVGKAGF